MSGNPISALQSEECGADDSCVVSELCNDYLGVLRKHSCVNFLLDKFLDGEKKRIALVAYAAAYAENVRLEDVDGVGDASFFDKMRSKLNRN